MKKTLLVLASLLMTMGAFAEEVVFDFVKNGLTMFPGITVGSTQDGQDVSTLTHDGDITEDKTATIDGISLTVTPSTGANANRIWTVKSSGATSMRLYDGTMTFSSTTKSIKRITFTDDSKWTDPTPSTGEFAQEKVWTGDASNVVLTLKAQCRIKTITVEYGDVVVEPVTKATYTKVNEISDGSYLIAANASDMMKVAQNMTSDKKYGYLSVTDAADANGTISLEAGNEFKFTAVDGGYTIQQVDGRYLYQTGTYNSFNLSDARVDGDVFTVVANGDGTFKITNVAMNKFMQYDTTYKSYGSYADARETGIMPSLYKLTESTGINTTTVATLDVNAPIYNLAGQRVNKDAKGILIQNGKKFIAK